MKVFKTLMNSPFMGNFLNPRRALKGSPKKVPTPRADPETLMDKSIIPNNSLSRLRIRENASLKPSVIEDIISIGKKAEDLNSFCLLPVQPLFCVGDEELIPVFIFKRSDSLLTFFRDKPVNKFHSFFVFYVLMLFGIDGHDTILIE